MKVKHNFLFFLILFICNWSFSQNCGTGDVTISTQAEVNTFVTTFAGTCNTIDGNLTIETNDVVDVSGLSFLNQVNGFININQTGLTTTNGLHNITNVFGQILLSQNNSLLSFEFSNLQSVSLFIKVDNASSITTIDLSSLNSIGGSIYFEGSTATFSTSVNYITLSNLSNLISADFSSLISVNYISIFSCSDLAILNLNNLTTIDVHFQIFNAPSLTSINIPQLKVIEDFLSLRFTGLTNFDDFDALRIVKGYVQIRDNDNLTNVDTLKNIQVIDSYLEIRNNPLLDECCAIRDFINGPNYISGALDILSNGANCSDTLDVILYCNENQIDTDVDSIIDSEDNCLSISNPNQEDDDNDGIGDVCDNCPNDANILQEDVNNNGIGDACEDSGTGADAGTDAGGLGIGTSSPNSQFEITQGDVFIKNPHRGVIMKAPNGKCFRVQPNNEGVLKSIEINCPDN